MTPKKNLDKGKAPMVDEELRSRRPNTRSRTAGIVIRERGAATPQVEAVEARETGVREVQRENVTPTSAPAMEDREQSGDDVRAEPRVGPTIGPSVGNAEGPSGVAAPTTEGFVTNTQLAGIMQMLMGVVQDMRHDMRQFFETSQPRTSSNPTSLGMPGAQGEERVQRQERDTAEVQVVDMRPQADEERQRMKDERANMKAFQDMRPPPFRGEMDYKVVDEWVMKMEKIFEYLRCNDDQKVRYATFMLDGEADRWWRTERERHCLEADLDYRGQNF